jgi:hypothetical protein
MHVFYFIQNMYKITCFVWYPGQIKEKHLSLSSMDVVKGD